MRVSNERNQNRMEKKTLGALIASLRKENGMTQLELAQKMGVTDKAVSKWERDLSCPDVNTLAKLAELFHLSVDEMMQGRTAPEEKQKNFRPLVRLILRAMGLAMGICVFVLSLLKQLDPESAFGMLGLGLACLALSTFEEKAEE